MIIFVFKDLMTSYIQFRAIFMADLFGQVYQFHLQSFYVKLNN